MVQAQATARFIRTSAQKAGLVLALIRGRAVNQAIATLRFTRKTVARDIEKVLQSAIANADSAVAVIASAVMSPLDVPEGAVRAHTATRASAAAAMGCQSNVCDADHSCATDHPPLA